MPHQHGAAQGVRDAASSLSLTMPAGLPDSEMVGIAAAAAAAYPLLARDESELW
jgi:hypothetical protein